MELVFLKNTLFKSKAFAPLLDGDGSVLVDIALLEERLNARLHGDDWCSDGDKFMVGDVFVVWLDIQIAELPDYRVDVFLLVVVLRFHQQLFPFEVVQLTALLELFHYLDVYGIFNSPVKYLEEPVAHTFGKLGHKIGGAFVELLACAKIFKMDFPIAHVIAFLTTAFAKAPLTVELA